MKTIDWSKVLSCFTIRFVFSLIWREKEECDWRSIVLSLHYSPLLRMKVYLFLRRNELSMQCIGIVLSFRDKYSSLLFPLISSFWSFRWFRSWFVMRKFHRLILEKELNWEDLVWMKQWNHREEWMKHRDFWWIEWISIH